MKVITDIRVTVKAHAPAPGKFASEVMDGSAVFGVEQGERSPGLGGSEHDMERLLEVDRAQAFALALGVAAAMGNGKGAQVEAWEVGLIFWSHGRVLIMGQWVGKV